MNCFYSAQTTFNIQRACRMNMPSMKIANILIHIAGVINSYIQPRCIVINLDVSLLPSELEIFILFTFINENEIKGLISVVKRTLF